jgi:hypothetical protein
MEPSSQKRKSVDDGIKYAVLIFSYIHIILLGLYFCTAVWDTQWNKIVSIGTTAFNSYNFLYWILFVYFVVNILQIVLLFVFMADNKNKPVIDIHFIWSILVAAYDFLMFLLFIGYYFFVINTNFSETLPFNDPFYCCYYWSGNPDQCYNTGPCVGYTNPLLPNQPFVLHWISTGVFFIIAILHVVINKMIRNAGLVSSKGNAESSWRAWGAFISYIYLGLYVYWAAAPLWDTIFIFGFPLLGIPPGPGPFYSNRYGYQWWFLFFISANILPPLFYFVAANNKKSALISWIFFAILIIVNVVTVVSLLVFVAVWIFQCNNSLWFVSGDSICNSYQYCCYNFASASNVCANTTPCPYSTSLYPNYEFVLHMIFGLVFWLCSTVMLWMWYRLSINGVISK